MNEKNFEYLKDQVKYTGFGEVLHEQLKSNLEKAQTQFQLEHKAQYGKDELSVSLHFKKSAQSDMYFFNSYTASLQKPGQTDPVSQSFYIGKDNTNITLKEAYNLLDGRAVSKELVSKEGNLYNAWLQLDFKQTTPSGNYKARQFSDQYGFDLEKALAKHPIKELENQQDRSRLTDSLQKGNRQSVTFLQDGNEQKRFVEASPQFKSITVYDEQNKRIRQAQSEKLAQNQDPSQQQAEKKDGQKQEVKPAGSKESQATSKKKGKGISV